MKFSLTYVNQARGFKLYQELYKRYKDTGFTKKEYDELRKEIVGKRTPSLNILRPETYLFDREKEPITITLKEPITVSLYFLEGKKINEKDAKILKRNGFDIVEIKTDVDEIEFFRYRYYFNDIEYKKTMKDTRYIYGKNNWNTKYIRECLKKEIEKNQAILDVLDMVGEM